MCLEQLFYILIYSQDKYNELYDHFIVNELNIMQVQKHEMVYTGINALDYS